MISPSALDVRIMAFDLSELRLIPPTEITAFLMEMPEIFSNDFTTAEIVFDASSRLLMYPLFTPEDSF